MRFISIPEIIAAIAAMPTSCDGKRTNYTVQFKKAVCEYMVRAKTTPHKMSNHVRMTTALMGKWVKQFEAGLYTMQGAYCVSKKSLSTNALILRQLNTEANLLQRKIELVKECELLGIDVQIKSG